ncbi:hypothetical protein [Spirochaeta isovalerica]|uniref:Uncharacterized protein n=1 Tax=Spirochaeta isovalerica TaxID=150 RepID=A0A841RDM1_9SPIO|nr:hypothetical protein [Spirochaeta isovalerica]MBB6481481.1 hypothetical protein [Spirochaeta isovalerica]
MNQDQVKALLLELDSDVEDFTLIYSGKMSKKVDGLYHPEKQEIIIHNKNFTEDNPLIYTAIHEFAHHIQFTRKDVEVTSRSHTVMFWDIFHRLLIKAEEKGIYKNLFATDERFIKLTEKIKSKYLHTNGELMKEFGKLLIEALDLCQQNHANFEDYVDRELGLNRTAAKSIMKVYAMDVNPEIGFDNMKIVAGIKEEKQRKVAEKAFEEGKSPDMVKAEIKEAKGEPDVTLPRLEAQKRRIEKSIHNLQQKLADVEMQIDEFKHEQGED